VSNRSDLYLPALGWNKKTAFRAANRQKKVWY